MTGTTSVSNVVLITIDSFRADALGALGDTADTPVLDGLAARGTVFRNAFAHGNWTPFSFPGILGSRSVFAEHDRVDLPRTPTLAEVLGEAGVRTAGFNAANGFLTAHWGYDRGFDTFEAFIDGDGSSAYSRLLAAHPTVQGWLELARSPFERLLNRARRGDDSQPFVDASRMLDVERRATAFIRETDEPFFLWLHYMDPHTPYVPAPRYVREVSSDRIGTHRMIRAHAQTGLGWTVGPKALADLRMLYRGTVRQVDASVGRVREALVDSGLVDETGVIVAGDHGEEFQEHGHLAHYPKLYEELVHVPLVIDAPGCESRRVTDHVGLDAVPPTVCDLLDVAADDDWDGATLGPTVRSGESPPDAPVTSVAVRGERVTQQPIPRRLADGDLFVSARTTRWTYIENTATGETELYDRRADPAEQHDLSRDDRPDAVDRLRKAAHRRAEGLVSQTDGTDGTDGEGIDSELTIRLRALGYR